MATANADGVIEPQDTDPTLITITRKYFDELVRASNWLNSLECAGVYNWEGIDSAHEVHREDYPEEDEE